MHFIFSSLLGLASGVSVPPEQTPAISGALKCWPGWRGSRTNGIVPRGKPAVAWSEAKNVRRKNVIPVRGNFSPVFRDELVFVTFVVPAGNR